MDQKVTLSPTEEQAHILELHRQTSDNLLIESGPGTGKSSMLKMLIEQTRENTVILAFSKSIKEEMEADLEEKSYHGWPLPPYSVKTVNGFGHSAWATALGTQLVLEKTKTSDILRTIIKELSRAEQTEYWESFNAINSAIGLAKSLGYVPTGKYPNATRLIEQDTFLSYLEEQTDPWIIDEVLHCSIQAAYSGTIDFDDQAYMPALFGGTFPQFPYVYIDELQDWSPVNHQMLRHLPNSRIIAVGDDAQSIFQFRGAKQGGMAHFAERHQAASAPLSVSFRCPEKIVENARWRMPTLKWIKPGGRVARLRNPASTSFPDGCAILCRNNAPLFALAIRLLSSGRSVNVAGSDIGPRLLRLMEKLGDELMPQAQVLDAIEAWRYDKLSKESKTADDYADCMRVFAQYGSNLRQALGYAEDLLNRSGTISLLTGHKAKGLEWPVVYHLDQWLLQDTEQDRNLRFVIETRAQETYYEIDSKDIRW